MTCLEAGVLEKNLFEAEMDFTLLCRESIFFSEAETCSLDFDKEELGLGSLQVLFHTPKLLISFSSPSPENY